MRYQVTDRCITCNTCTAFCPTGAIRPGEIYFEIFQGTCCKCGKCAEKCPAQAIKKESDGEKYE